MELEFDEAAHEYRWDGQIVPSVTQALKPLDADDLAKVPPDVLEFARLRGTLAHKACEYFDQGRLDESSLDPEIAGYVQSWIEFRRVTGYTPILTEHRFYHPQLGYAGTIDSVGQYGGSLAVLDRKTSATLLPSVGPQLAAYQHAPGVKALRRYAIQLMADGSIAKAHAFTDADDWRCFTAMLATRSWRTKHGL